MRGPSNTQSCGPATGRHFPASGLISRIRGIQRWQYFTGVEGFFRPKHRKRKRKDLDKYYLKIGYIILACKRVQKESQYLSGKAAGGSGKGGQAGGRKCAAG